MPVRIVAISDTHDRHRDLVVPEGDLLIHAGDITKRGDPAEVRDLDEWLGALPHPEKVIVAGNHDFCFEKDLAGTRSLLRNARLLHDSGVSLFGLEIWGSPWQPWFHDWAFNLARGPEIRAKWDLIPSDTDVLVTHGPPRGHGDRTFRGEQVGCDDLLEAVRRIGPKLHVFGHIHEDAGITREGGTIFANASSCDLSYRAVQPPLVIDL